METISKFVLVLTVFTLAGGLSGCSDTSDGKLFALGCDIYAPNGYDLSPGEKGNIHAMYAGPDSGMYPVIQYLPNAKFEDHVSENNIGHEVLSEERLGHLRFLKVKLPAGDYNFTWDVVVGESGFFASDTMHGTEILDQFMTCAKATANKSLNADASDAGAG